MDRELTLAPSLFVHWKVCVAGRLYFRRWLRRATSSLQTTPEVPVLLSEIQSGVCICLAYVCYGMLRAAACVDESDHHHKCCEDSFNIWLQRESTYTISWPRHCPLPLPLCLFVALPLSH